MSRSNGSGVFRDSEGNVTIVAPPAKALGAAPLPGQLVPTPKRLSQPTTQLTLNLAFSQLPDVLEALWNVMGEQFDYVINPQVLAMMAPDDLLRLQKILREREERGHSG